MDSEIFLSIPQIKLERSESPIEVDTYFRQGSPVNLHANVRETLTGINREMESIQSRNVHSSTRRDQVPENSWIDELLDFSSIVSRQTQSCLNRIKCDFKRSGMKFDADFRNHFLYIANNRIAESYDGFLIGLSNDMKSDDCKINKPNPNLVTRPGITNNEPNVTPLAKRKRPDDETENAIYIDPKVVQRVHSNRTSHATLGNANKNDSITSVTKVMVVNKSQVSTSTTLTASKLDDDVVFCGTEIASKMNAVKDRKKNLDAARGRTDFYMFMAENRVSSPKNLDRRMTIAGPVVSIPNNQSNAQTKQRNALNSSNQSKPTASENARNVQKEMVSARRKTTIDRESTKINIPLPLAKVSKPFSVRDSQKQMNMTLPTLSTNSQIVTRSRGIAPSYACDHCRYTTGVRTNLIRHNLTHTGEKPFTCKFCEKGFTQKVNLLSHMRSNHHEMHGDPTYWEL